MKTKQLESMLCSLQTFSNPKWALEQYQTPPRLAAQVVKEAAERDDVEERAVLDLGCGAGEE